MEMMGVNGNLFEFCISYIKAILKLSGLKQLFHFAHGLVSEVWVACLVSDPRDVSSGGWVWGMYCKLSSSLKYLVLLGTSLHTDTHTHMASYPPDPLYLA